MTQQVANPITPGIYKCDWQLKGGHPKDRYTYYNYWTGSKWMGGYYELEVARRSGANGEFLSVKSWTLLSWLPALPFGAAA